MKSTLSDSASAASSASVTNNFSSTAEAGGRVSQLGRIMPSRIDVVNNPDNLEQLMSSGEVGSATYFDPVSKLAQAAQAIEDKAWGSEGGSAQGNEDVLRMPDEELKSKKALKEQVRAMERVTEHIKAASIQNTLAARDVVEKFLYGDGAKTSKQKKAPVLKNLKLSPDNIAHPDNQKKMVELVKRVHQYSLADEEVESLREALKKTLGMHVVYRELYDLSLKCEESITESRVSLFDHAKKAIGNDVILYDLIKTIRSSAIELLSAQEFQLQISHPYNSRERIMNFKLMTLIEPQYEGGYIGLIMAHIASKSFDDAFPLFRKLESCISSNPRESKVKAKAAEAYYYFMQGIHELIIDRPKEAIKSFKESLKKDNEIIGGLAASPEEEYTSKMRIHKNHYHIAETLESKEEAKEHYNKAIKAANVFIALPEDSIKERALAKTEKEMAFFIKGVCPHKIRNYGESIKVLDELLKINPNDMQGLVAQSENYLQIGQFVKCREYALQAENLLKANIVDANRGIDVDDMQFIINMRLARAYLHEGNFNEAKKYGLELIDKDSNSATGLDTLAKAYYALGEYEKAIFYCKKVLAKSPNEVFILADLADALYQGNEFDEALKYYMRVLPLKHESQDSYDIALLRIGQIYYEKKELEVAKDYLKKCNLVIAQKLLATIFCHQDEPEKASAVISSLKAVSPEDESLKSYELEILKLLRVKEEQQLPAESVSVEDEPSRVKADEIAEVKGKTAEERRLEKAAAAKARAAENREKAAANSKAKKKAEAEAKRVKQDTAKKAAQKEAEDAEQDNNQKEAEDAEQDNNQKDDSNDLQQDDNGLPNKDGERGTLQTFVASANQAQPADTAVPKSKGGKVDNSVKSLNKAVLSPSAAAFTPSENQDYAKNVTPAAGSLALPAPQVEASVAAVSVAAAPQSNMNNVAPLVHSGNPYGNYPAPMTLALGQWVYEPYNNAYMPAGVYSMSHVHSHAISNQVVDLYAAHQQFAAEMAQQMQPGGALAPPPAYDF